MTIDPTQIDSAVLKRVERLANERGCTVDEILQIALDSIDRPKSPDGLVGLFADDPGLVDDLMRDVYASRDQGLRHTPAILLLPYLEP